MNSDPKGYVIVCAGGPGGRSMVGGVSALAHRKIRPAAPAAVVSTSSAAAHIAAVNELIDSGDTDGLPVIPPTDEAIAELIEGSGRRGDDALGRFGNTGAVATVRDLARSAAMAGCLPEQMPVVCAAFELIVPQADLLAGPHGAFPWVIVNGLIRERTKLNSTQNVFGPSVHANAAVGRAIRLGLLRIGGIRPGALGSAYQYTCGTIGENEEDSPWAPFHTEQGLVASDSAVTVAIAESPAQASGHEVATIEGFLYAFADEASTISSLDPSYGLVGAGKVLIGLGSDARTHAKEQGWSRRQAQELVFKELTRSVGDARRLGMDGGRLSARDDADRIALCASPDDVFVLAVGGGGAHNMVARLLSAPRTKKVP